MRMSFRDLKNKYLGAFLGSLLVLTFVISLSLSFFYLKDIDKRTLIDKIPFGVKEELKSQIRWIENIPYFFYKFKSSDLPVYDLYIDRKDLRQLNNNLPGLGELLGEENKKYEPAEFVFDDKRYDVKVKYRGTGDLHWLYDKKSWRIKFKDEYFNRMNEIDLVIPSDRQFIAAYLSAYRARKMGLLSPLDDFVILRVNGKVQGVYLKYEHWSKEWLEKNNITGDANLYGEKYFDENIFEQTDFWKKYTTDLNSKVDNFAEIDLLLDLLNNTTDEEFNKNIWNIIDEENFYNWQIHSVLAESAHQDNGHNIRLYFNNTIGKFQIIPWDVGTIGIDGDEDLGGIVTAVGYNKLVKRILENSEFLLKRNLKLWEYVGNEKNLEDDLKIYDETYKKVRVAFYNDRNKNYSNKFFDTQIEKFRNDIINNFYNARNFLDKSEVYQKNYLNADGNNKVTINLNIKSFSPLALKGISIQNSSFKENLDIFYDINQNGVFDKNDNNIGRLKYDESIEGYVVDKLDEVILSSDTETLNTEPLKYIENLKILGVDYKFFLVSYKVGNIASADVNIELENYITKNKVSKNITYIDEKTFKYFDKIGLSIDEFVKENPIFKKVSDKKIVVYAGTYRISKDIIIPKNLEVEIKQGANFYLDIGVSIISYSPVRADYVKFLPINRNEGWGVFGIIDTEQKSEFNNCIFERGGDEYINGIYLSGQLSSYSSDIEIKGSSFKYANGDDGLNIKNAEAIVLDSHFIENGFDGFDMDFVSGRVENSEFIGNKNDGIDISGSKNLIIKNNIIKNSADKGISVGEKASLLILNNYIEGCIMGIAVKDLSTPEIKDNNLVSNEIGVSAYQKKEIFGGGFPKLENNIFTDNKKDTETDEISEIYY